MGHSFWNVIESAFLDPGSGALLGWITLVVVIAAIAR